MGANLVTLQEYKAYQGISGTGQDAQINSLIPKVSNFVKGVCRRTFVDSVDEQKTEIFGGGTYLIPTETPILQIVGLETSENYGQTYTALVEFVDWALDMENQVIVPLKAYSFKPLTNGYRLTYTGGYEEIPDDLKLATLDLITYYLKNESSVHSVTAITNTNAQVQYLSGSNLPGHIKRVLDLYVANYN